MSETHANHAHSVESLIEQVAGAARRDHVFDGVHTVVVGCSGGCDSTVLLDVLVRLAPRFDLRLGVAHLHHGWRGAEADADLDLAAAHAARYDVSFFAGQAELASAPGSREAAARDARLRFFATVAQGWPADAIALGHTADDQLETVLFNLARGTGRRGLGGMRPRAKLGELVVLRPLLDRTRAEVRGFARDRSLQWREDASNADISLARNRLRHRLLGELQQINAGAVRNVARAARLLREEEDWLEEMTGEVLERLRCEEEYPGGVGLRRVAILELPAPLRRRVLLRALAGVRGRRRGIGSEHIERLVGLIATPAPQGAIASDLPGVRVRVDEQRIRLLPLAGRRLKRPGAV